MSAAFRSQMEVALELAVQQQFCSLFKVLYTEADKEAYKRFNAGLVKLAETEATVGVIIAELE